MIGDVVLSALLGAFVPLSAPAQPTAPLSVSIESQGGLLSGRFYQSGINGPRPTLLLIPGWPGSSIDVLGMGARLVEEGINVLVVNPRGMHESEGMNTFAGTLVDIGSCLDWLRSSKACLRFRIDPSNILLGGHSFGGGMVMAYAASDSSVRRIISIAGTDHGEFIRQFERDSTFAAEMREALRSTQAPNGPVRFDLDLSLRELMHGRQQFGLRENASRLADRDMLLIGGWEDLNTTVDQYLLPLYRSLKEAGAENVQFLVYHDDHGFRQVRDQLAEDISGWVRGRNPE